MKNYIKGLLGGIAIMSFLFVIPVFAQTIEAIFNDIRISISGIDKVQWGENYILGDGREVPYSIMYNDTTYLPLRKIGELTDKTIYWNRDTKTATLTDNQFDTPTVITEKPDARGNVWSYYIFKTEKNEKYLGVKDSQRGYERVYKIAGGGYEIVNAMGNIHKKHYVYTTNESIFFARYLDDDRAARLWKIDFYNDINSQDGNEMSDYFDTDINIDKLLFCGDFLICIDARTIYAFNMITKESVSKELNLNFGNTIDELLITNIDILRSPENNPIPILYKFRGGTSGGMMSGSIKLYHDGEMRFE
ncbi:MAG: hypothetical protein GX800_06035 [Clostridiaceae bacterium]|nr:hypothetical protein [Clostridiaceae bacterium]